MSITFNPKYCTKYYYLTSLDITDIKIYTNILCQFIMNISDMMREKQQFAYERKLILQQMKYDYKRIWRLFLRRVFIPDIYNYILKFI